MVRNAPEPTRMSSLGAEGAEFAKAQSFDLPRLGGFFDAVGLQL
jgi:hypothetical protein